MIRILSLGAGVQSSALLLMSIKGVLPKLDHAIFADTQWEPAEVYAQLEFLKGECWKADIPLHVVTAGNLREHVLEAARTGKRVSSPPFFTGTAEGVAAPINRSCTSDFKIAPIERKVKELMGHNRGSRLPKECLVEQWLGISADEIQRMKCSTVPWFRFWHPLLENEMAEGGGSHYPLKEHGLTRSDCLAWMKANGYPDAPRSACIGCPFHNNHEWRKIRADPVQWKDAVEFDRAVRGFASDKTLHGMRQGVYLHRSLLPLDQAPIDTDVPGQESLFGMGQECHGMCGV